MGIAALVGCPRCGTGGERWSAGLSRLRGGGARDPQDCQHPLLRLGRLGLAWSGLDAESLRCVQESFYAEARRVLDRHGGNMKRGGPVYEDHRLKGHLYGIGYLKGDEYPRHRRFREPALAAEQSSYVRISTLEARIAKLEATLGELVLLGMERAALAGK